MYADSRNPELNMLFSPDGKNLSAEQIIDIISGLKDSKLTGFVNYFFEQRSFLERPLHIKRRVAQSFHSYNAPGSWLCEFGLPEDIPYIRSFISNGYFFRINGIIKKLVSNSSLDKAAISEFLSDTILQRNSILLTFFDIIPEEKLDISVLAGTVMTAIPQSYVEVREKVTKIIRSHVELDETVPKGLPDEWILRIAGGFKG